MKLQHKLKINLIATVTLMGIKSNEFVTHEISILRTGKNYKVNIKSAIKLTNTIYIYHTIRINSFGIDAC